MSLREFFQSDAVVLSKESSLREAAEVMSKNHIGSVVVVEKSETTSKKPIGIITDRDIALAVAKVKDFDASSPVQGFMSKDVILCSINDGLHETIHKMKSNGIRRMPVVDRHDNLVGMISSDDIVRLLGNELKDVSEVLTHGIDRESNIFNNLTKDQQLQA